MSKGKGPTYVVPFKRRRLGKTNYRKRLALIKSGLPRLVVRTSNKAVVVELMEFKPIGDQVLAYAHSNELIKFGWPARRNLPTAYLTGLLCSLKFKRKSEKVGEKINRFVLDIGLSTANKNSICFSAMKGAIDAGLETNYDPEMIDESRIAGVHISEYAKKLKEADESLYRKRFSAYLNKGIRPEELTKLFETVKRKITSTLTTQQ